MVFLSRRDYDLKYLKEMKRLINIVSCVKKTHISITLVMTYFRYLCDYFFYQDLNLGSYIYYALFLSTELSSRGHLCDFICQNIVPKLSIDFKKLR